MIVIGVAVGELVVTLRAAITLNSEIISSSYFVHLFVGAIRIHK